MDESDILDDGRLYDELHVDNGWAANSDSADSGEEELDEGEAADEDDDVEEDGDDADGDGDGADGVAHEQAPEAQVALFFLVET